MKPLGNNLIVKQLPFRKPTGGIAIPEAYADAMNYGDIKVYEVLAVGPGRINGKGVRIPIECETGDRIICSCHTEGARPMDDERQVISADLILAVIPNQS